MVENRINIRGIYFDNVNLDEAAEKCELFLKEDKPHIICTPNSEIVEVCVKDENYRKIINSADLVIPDGAGVVLASKILSKKLEKGKVPGIELCERICKIASDNKYSIFFLGSKPGYAEQAADNLKEKYPDFIIAGTNDGYFKDDSEVIEKINNSKADVLFVCLGAPKQEKWMHDNKDKLNIKIMGGFGGSIDVFSGNSERAPDFYVNHGLEWFYRLKKEPKRIGRMMNIPKFLLGSVKDRIFRIER